MGEALVGPPVELLVGKAMEVVVLVTTPLKGPVELLPSLGAGTSVEVALLPSFGDRVVVGASGTPPMFSKLAQAIRVLLAK